MKHFPEWGGDAVQIPAALLLRAMTAYKLGDENQARELLERGVTEMKKRVPKPDAPQLAAYLPDCWGKLEVLKREAEGMINGPARWK